jgi:glycogen operon protein
MACTLVHPRQNEKIHLLFNAFWEELSFDLPKTHSKKWRRIADTSLNSPEDFCEISDSPAVRTKTYGVPARSAVMLYLKE